MQGCNLIIILAARIAWKGGRSFYFEEKKNGTRGWRGQCREDDFQIHSKFHSHCLFLKKLYDTRLYYMHMTL